MGRGRGGDGEGTLRCKGAPTGEVILSGVDVVHTGGEERMYRDAGECKIALKRCEGEMEGEQKRCLDRGSCRLSVQGSSEPNGRNCRQRNRSVECSCWGLVEVEELSV